MMTNVSIEKIEQRMDFLKNRMENWGGESGNNEKKRQPTDFQWFNWMVG